MTNLLSRLGRSRTAEPPPAGATQPFALSRTRFGAWLGKPMTSFHLIVAVAALLVTLGLIMVLALLLLAVFGSALAPYPEHIAGGVNTAKRFLAPSFAHPFGTNELGQDVFSLVLAGTRVSVLAGFAVVLLGTVTGTIIGAIAVGITAFVRVAGMATAPAPSGPGLARA